MRAIAFGGVPIGVPMPPMFAATGIARTSATLPLPLFSIGLRSGAITANIMAVVAVLLINMEKKAVTNIKPSSTVCDFVPKGLKSTRARFLSSPTLPAPIARKNPPKKSIMMGSAKVAINALYLMSVPNA